MSEQPQQDVIAIYCAHEECGTRMAGPTRDQTKNVLRDARRERDKVLASAEGHLKRHGPAEVLTCADLHEMAGLSLLGCEADSLVQWGRGRTPTCPYEVHLLGGWEPLDGWRAVLVDMLLPHWHRGCVTLQRAVERIPDDRAPLGPERPIHRASCRACEWESEGVFPRHAVVLAFDHASEHLVGEVTVEGVVCRACAAFEVTGAPPADGLPVAVGAPRECLCEAPAFWGMTYV